MFDHVWESAAVNHVAAKKPAKGKRSGQLDLFTGRTRLARDPYEIALHGLVVDTLTRWASDGWFFTHFPAGGRRDAKTAAKLKRMGTKPGVPDLILFAPDPVRGAHFLELKRRGGRLSPAQQAFADWARGYGYCHEVVADYDSALAVLRGWGVIRTGIAPQ
jgi:hypothetical protein